MMLPKLNLKNTLMCAALLGLAGCGCNDDSTLTTLPGAQPAIGGLRASTSPIPVLPPEVELEPLRIDVAIVMDDSDSMNQGMLGIIPNRQEDERVRQDAVRAIMEKLEGNITARLQQEWLDSGLTPEQFPDIDLAFAVARFEDFGGDFTNNNRRFGDVDDSTNGYGNPNNDMDARPFILNMPILRQNHPQFAARFAAALEREAPGDGNPRFDSGFQRIAISDPQSAIEALYQVAAPANQDGTFGGFDANGNSSTLDSGAPTSLDPTRNPQTRPGDSGDVPAIGFALLGEKDPDLQAQYAVKDELGNDVMIPNPVGGAPIPSISSGKLGGVGWRECSARFVILSSDVATVAPTNTPPQGTKEPLAKLPPPAISETVSSSDGSATPAGDPAPAPRGARTTQLGAFDSGFQIIGGSSDVVPRRIGVANGPSDSGRTGNGVAPVGAHTVQETINALNELDIEVLCIGSPFRGGLDTKPGVAGVNGDSASDIGSVDFDPSNPAIVQPDMAPWFYFNALTRLTMPEITSVPLGGGEELFPAVYNLGTVWPLQADDTDGSEKTGIKDTITDDLIERIRQWVDEPSPFLQSPTLKTEQGPTERPSTLPTMNWKFSLEIFPQQGGDVVQLIPAGASEAPTVFEQTRSLPVYWDDETAPADVTFDSGSLTFLARNASVPLPATMLLPFKLTAQFLGLDGVTPENQAFADKAIENIKKRGDGVNPLANETDAFTHAEGVILVTVRGPGDFGPSFQLVTFAEGAIIVNDLAPGRDNSDQVGGTGAAFPPAPSDD